MGEMRILLTSIEIHGDIIQVQLCNGIVDAFEICIVGIRALGHTHVGDKVGQAVRL